MTTGDDAGAAGTRRKRPATPRQLTFVGLSDDGSALVLADSRGTSFEVRLEGRLTAALRLDHRSGQMEIALTTLTPREIQARIRQGATVAELAEESGMDPARVDRFAGPPLGERQFIAERARATMLASRDGGHSLEELVIEAALADGASPDALRWDAWLREDGSWAVLAAYPAGKADRITTWSFDPHSAVVSAADEASRALIGSGTPVLTLVGDESDAGSAAADDEPAIAKPPAKRGASRSRARAADATDPDAIDDTAADTADDATVDAAPDRGSDHGGVDAEPAPASRTTRRGRRASVPTWDEILFGAGDEDPAS